VLCAGKLCHSCEQPMHSIDVICRNTQQAADDIRLHFRERPQTTTTLARFWNLKDHLERLVEAADDYQSETFLILSTDYPGLILKVIDVLRAADQLNYSENVAIQDSCSAINRLLQAVERLKHSKAASASA
jgi:hypothetical protein